MNLYAEEITTIQGRAVRILESFDTEDEDPISLIDAAKATLVALGMILDIAVTEKDSETILMIRHAANEMLNVTSPKLVKPVH